MREGGGYQFHPATTMWRGYGPALNVYLKGVIEEWVSRGFVNNMPNPRTIEGCKYYELPTEWASGPIDYPPWIGYERFHSRHRAALKHKDPKWYGQFGWTEAPMIDYFWPGKQPELGDYIISPNGKPYIVAGYDQVRGYCALASDALPEYVTKRQLYIREWQKANRA